ncbi:MAG TPA: phosphotransferase, partial [Anaerolineaceae bacterium]|nr:phosphotransferase [Anaerolineaceae bacterium]
MNQNIARRYSPEILQQALERFAVHTPLDLEGFDSYVYECQNAQGPYILKITHTLRQSQNELEGELDFTAYLVNQGAPVVKPLPSIHSKLVEAIPDSQGENFLAFVCQKAPG